MTKLITSELLVAYSHCFRKAFLVLHAENQGIPHDYVRLVEQQTDQNRLAYLNKIHQKYPGKTISKDVDLQSGEGLILKTLLNVHNLVANCDLLIKVDRKSLLGNYSYEPLLATGTHQIIKEQRILLAFSGYVLGKLQNFYLFLAKL